ncbi:MAG: hypothetical protein JWP66_795 [Naasia sp.]|nr:hypothetical protein [Naasia sp.]
MVARVGARITNVSASHAVFLTQAGVLADTIDDAARGAGSAAS